MMLYTTGTAAEALRKATQARAASRPTNTRFAEAFARRIQRAEARRAAEPGWVFAPMATR